MTGNKRSGPVPKGWMHCPPNGKHLVASKFMPLKTPLSENFDTKVPNDLRYPPQKLFYLARRNDVLKKQVKISLWIDLTNTDRYYHKEDIQKEGCKYFKLRLPGHGETPNSGKIRQFISLVHNHISNRPFDCIAIHCTHGFNRTGFLITCFLVEQMHYNVTTALELFARSRPPGIYRENYIKELYRRYGAVADILPTPPLPQWVEEKTRTRERKRFNEDR